MPARLRNAAKALIRRDGKVLVTEYTDDKGKFYALPGGSLHPGSETLEQALHRECLKELGTVVKIQGLTCVREYIADNHEFFAPWTAGVHHIDFIFTCGVDDAFDLSVVKRPLPPFWGCPVRC